MATVTTKITNRARARGWLQFSLYTLFRTDLRKITYPGNPEIRNPPENWKGNLDQSCIIESICWIKKLSSPHLRKRYICAFSPRPPFLQLNRTRQSFGWCSLISHPVNSGKWVSAFFFSPRLHDADCEIFCADTFYPWSNSVVDCHRVIQLHVIDGYLDMNLFIRIKPVWRERNSLTVRIWPFWNVEKIYTTPKNWETCEKIIFCVIFVEWLFVGD